MYINVVLKITFQNNLNYASTSNIRKLIKFYNLGDKTFETDFSAYHLSAWALTLGDTRTFHFQFQRKVLVLQ